MKRRGGSLPDSRNSSASSGCSGVCVWGREGGRMCNTGGPGQGLVYLSPSLPLPLTCTHHASGQPITSLTPIIPQVSLSPHSDSSCLRSAYHQHSSCPWVLGLLPDFSILRVIQVVQLCQPAGDGLVHRGQAPVLYQLVQESNELVGRPARHISMRGTRGARACRAHRHSRGARACRAHRHSRGARACRAHRHCRGASSASAG